MVYGDGVRLRSIERDDLPRFVQWLNDPETRQGLAVRFPMGMAEEEHWFEENLKAEPGLRALALDAHAESPAPAATANWTHIGGTGFHKIDWGDRWGEIGILIGNKEYWNRGYGTEATRTLVRWGFDGLNLNRIWLRVYEDNARAIRCYEKVGFRIEGRLRQDRFRDGRYLDTIIMAILRDEFRADKASA